MNISIIRGDTAKFSFYRKDKDGHVILSQPEAIYFSVKNSPYESKTIIQKKLSDMEFDDETGKYTFYINPEYTNNLVYGTFDYDIEVKDTIDELQYTKTIAIGKFEIQKEITFSSNEV